MTTATAIEWMDATEFAEVPTPRDLQEFFGIPPSPPDDLGANIRAKRKYWKKKAAGETSIALEPENLD